MGTKGNIEWLEQLRVDRASAVPQFEQISRYIRRAIEQHRLKPGDQLPTNRQFLEHLNVNHKTVQHAITRLAEEGYVARWRGRGTFVQSPPRRGLIGLFTLLETLDTNQHSFYGTMLSLLGNRITENGLGQRVYMASAMEDTPSSAYEDMRNDLEAGHLAGLILMVQQPPLDPILEAAARKGIPAVAMTRHSKAPYTVISNSRSLIETAQRVIADGGRTRTGFVFNEHKLRHHTPASALASLGVPDDPQHPVVWQVPTMAGGYAAAASLPMDRLDSLVVEDDVMALGVDRWFAEHRVDVPGRLLAITHWNRGSRFELQMPFIRIENDLEEIADQVFGLLSDALAGRPIRQPCQHRRFHLVHATGRGSASRDTPAQPGVPTSTAGSDPADSSSPISQSD